MILSNLLFSTLLAAGLATSSVVPPQGQHFLADSTPNKAIETRNYVRNALKNASIIPDIVGDFIPSLLLNVTWDSKQYYKTAKLGNTIKPKKLQTRPIASLFWPPMPKNASLAETRKRDVYTQTANNLVLVMTDPDAPSRLLPIRAQHLHWIQQGLPVNITDDEASDSSASSWPRQIAEYQPPNPPVATGKHRYVLLAFSPANGTSDPLHLVAPTLRNRFDVQSWAMDHGLLPIAANFFYAQYHG